MPSRHPGDVAPGSDAGSDTFSRFFYQGCLAIPYCLQAAVGREIKSVILEHFEDIVLECEVGWRFIQVKTRDAGLGLWLLSTLLSPGGALRSLFRTFTDMGDLPATYEAHLEGAISNRDPIRHLTGPLGDDRSRFLESVEGRRLVNLVASSLGPTEAETNRFLSMVRVVSCPVRESIVDRNLRLLGDQAPELTTEAIRQIHEDLVRAVLNAMSAQRFSTDLPAAIREPNASRFRELFERKRLTAEKLRQLLQSLVPKPRLLLQRIMQPAGSPPTVLEEKLLVGGATVTVVNDARSLRANATKRRVELLSSSLFEKENELEDLHERLIVLANSLVATARSTDRPAELVWAALLARLEATPSTYDRFRLFDGDPFLLLGEVCDLSDQCLIEWRASGA